MVFRFRSVWEPSVFGTAGFVLGYILFKHCLLPLGQVIVYKIMR